VSDDIAQVAAFETENHQDAWRVRNMLQAAGIDAEVCPRSQWVLAPSGVGVFPEAPWYVLILDDDKAERARDLAERWRIRFEMSDGA
jgi:hypothetical protein